MKRKSKPDAALVGNVANNPRYDKVYSARNGMDAKAIKDGEDNTIYGSMQSNFRKRLERYMEVVMDIDKLFLVDGGNWMNQTKKPN
jgi:hypothetical protein